MKFFRTTASAVLAAGVLTFGALNFGIWGANSAAKAAGLVLNDVLVEAGVPSITIGFENDFDVRINYFETPTTAFLGLSGGAVDAENGNLGVYFKLDGVYWDWSFIILNSREGFGIPKWDGVFVDMDVQHVVNPPGHHDEPEGETAYFSHDIDGNNANQNGFVSRTEEENKQHAVPPFNNNAHMDLYSFTLLGNVDETLTSYEITDWSFSATADHIGAVPVPAALPLFLSALAGLGFFGWRRKRAPA